MDDWRKIKCKGCGFTIFQEENVKFCQNCGHKLPEFKPTLVTCPCCMGSGKVTKTRARRYCPLYIWTPRFWNKGDTNE